MRKKKKPFKRVAALALAGAMTASTVAMPALADTYYLEDGSITVAGRDDSQYVTQEGNSEVQGKKDGDVTIKMDNPDTGGSAITVTNNTITLDVTVGDVTVTIEDVNIQAKGDDTPEGGNDSAITIVGDGTNDDKSDGDTSNDNDHTATIEIDGNNVVTGSNGGAGIEVGAGADLVIQDENPSQGDTADSLTATGGNGGAGIGADRDSPAGDITITGGTVEATSVYGGAGIGGGIESSVGNITIEGGTVTAEGGDYAAGIGGGRLATATVGDITIEGGTVTAEGGDHAAGIGGGFASSVGDIAIEGGTVTAEGGDYAAGIGGGREATATVGDITIEGGTVTAEGGDYAAGIGGGDKGRVENITITDSDVTATGGVAGAGIGGGVMGGLGIYDEETEEFTCSNITITGGMVTATGGEGGAGIGAGFGAGGGTYFPEVGDITITGGTVTATAGAERIIHFVGDGHGCNEYAIEYYASNSEDYEDLGEGKYAQHIGKSAGIGSGVYSGVGNITIGTDADVVAKGNSCDIGLVLTIPDESEPMTIPEEQMTEEEEAETEQKVLNIKEGARVTMLSGNEEHGDMTLNTDELYTTGWVKYGETGAEKAGTVIPPDCYDDTSSDVVAMQARYTLEELAGFAPSVTLNGDKTHAMDGVTILYQLVDEEGNAVGSATTEKPTAVGTYTVQYQVKTNDGRLYSTVTKEMGTIVVHEDCYSGTVTTSGAGRVKAEEVDIVVTTDTTATNVGTIKVYYNGSEEKPTAVGDYTVTYALIPSDTVHYDTVTGTVGTLVIHEDCYKGEVVASGLDGENPAEVVLNKLTENTEHLAGTKIYFNGSEELPTNPGEYLVTYRLVSADSKYYDDVVGALGTLVIPVPSVETEGVYYLAAIDAQIRVEISSSEQDKTVVEINNVSEEVLTYFEKVVESDVITIQNTDGETLQLIVTGNVDDPVVIRVRGKNGKIITLYGRWA